MASIFSLERLEKSVGENGRGGGDAERARQRSSKVLMGALKVSRPLLLKYRLFPDELLRVVDRPRLALLLLPAALVREDVDRGLAAGKVG